MRYQGVEMTTTSQTMRTMGRAPVAPGELLLTRSREIGRFFIDDIRIRHQLQGSEGFTLKTQRWTSRIIWG